MSVSVNLESDEEMNHYIIVAIYFFSLFPALIQQQQRNMNASQQPMVSGLSRL